MSDFLGPVSVEEKRKQRLARNRQSARECRKRKKMKQMTLSQQLAHLEAENLQLRLKLKVGPEAAKLEEEKVGNITSQLEAIIKDGASEAVIHKFLSEMKERYSDYGRDRRSAIEFHMAQIRRSLQSTRPTRTILWLITNASRFFETNGDIRPPGSERSADAAQLIASLSEAVRLTKEQRAKLVQECTAAAVRRSASSNSLTSDSSVSIAGAAATTSATVAAGGGSSSVGGATSSSSAGVSSKISQIPTNERVRNVATATENIMVRLEELVSERNESLDQEMSEVQRILSPLQIAKFVLWIDENPVCMQMLEALWPHFATAQANLVQKKQQGGRRSDSEGEYENDDDDGSSSADEEH